MSAFISAEKEFLSYLEKEALLPHLRGGVLLGFSGGKDSSLLLALLSRLAKKEGFVLAALHVHHGIRGEEADRDAAFCQKMCEEMCIPFFLSYTDVPRIAAEKGEGIEETARKERYRLLLTVAEREGLSCVVTAHNATDNTETVFMHLLRGGGGNALCGIQPIRSLAPGAKVLLLRPLLCLTEEEILQAVSDGNVSFVTDSTNADTAYRRNYLRKELLPLLRAYAPKPERAVSRMTENLRSDMALLDEMAERAYARICRKDVLSRKGLAALPQPLAYRVLRLLHAKGFPELPLPERVHMDAFFACIDKTEHFSVSFPGGISAVAEGDTVFFSDGKSFSHSCMKLQLGENILLDGGKLYILEKGCLPQIENIYTLSIHAPLSSATIIDGLYVRAKEEGDAYRTCGVTHKLKKLFSDADIPPRVRGHMPVVCDQKGILWVPPFTLRDERNTEDDALYLVYVPPKELEDILTAVLEKKRLKKKNTRPKGAAK